MDVRVRLTGGLSTSGCLIKDVMCTHSIHIVIILHDQKTKATGLATTWIPDDACLTHRSILLKLLF